MLRDTCEMPLRPETVERVVAMWSARWPAPHEVPTVSVVTIGDRTFSTAPPHLRDRLIDPPTNVDALVARLGGDVERFGTARLAYADDRTLRPVGRDGIEAVPEDDPRLGALERSADHAEWLEASADEPCEARYGVAEKGELLALSTMQVWEDAVGHFGVFTRADRRNRGLAGRVAGHASAVALDRGLVAQWRSSEGNVASAAVADRLGFVTLGWQLFVRVRTDHAQ
jgi:RimJ/RimL family protein N-acetyltransferase